MPLLDSFGREIVLAPRRLPPRRAFHKRAKPKVPHAAPKGASPPSNHPITLILTARHNLGGVFYGPGPVSVPPPVARTLQEGEYRAAQTDANFAGSRACVIGPGRSKGGLSVKEVAPEYFDMPELAVLPFGVVDRTTGQFRFN